jgi:hypothetical protein
MNITRCKVLLSCPPARSNWWLHWGDRDGEAPFLRNHHKVEESKEEEGEFANNKTR